MNPKTDACTVTILLSAETWRKMPPEKKSAKPDSNSTESVNWTDNEVELLLGIVRSYFSQKDYECLDVCFVIKRFYDQHNCLRNSQGAQRFVGFSFLAVIVGC